MTPRQLLWQKYYKKNRKKYLAKRRGVYAANPKKHIARVLRRNKKNPKRLKEIERKTKLRQLYNLSVEDYDRMLSAQCGACAICNEPPSKKRRLCVDHDHSTMVIRGLLCYKCNLALGFLKDQPVLCIAAAKYLRKHDKKRKI